MQNENIVDSQLILDNRKKISLTGVEGIIGFSEQFIKLKINGVTVNITGNGIKITSFSKNNGNFSADGYFDGIKYGAEKVGIIKRLFK